MSQCRALNAAFILLCILGTLFISSAVGFARTTVQVELAPEIVGKINLVLRFNDALYAALISRNEELVARQLGALDVAITEANDVVETRYPSGQDPRHSFLHAGNLKSIFSDLRKSIRSAQMSEFDRRKEHIRSIFNKMVLITKTYKISHAYKTFFCKIDRSTWLQRGSNPKNPVLVDTNPNCGSLVK